MTISQELAERVCPCAARVPGRVYPVDRPGPGEADGFSTALVREVADVLTANEFPAIEDDSPDWYALMWCLWRYCYGHTTRGRHGHDPGSASEDPATERGCGGQA